MQGHPEQAQVGRARGRAPGACPASAGTDAARCSPEAREGHDGGVRRPIREHRGRLPAHRQRRKRLSHISRQWTPAELPRVRPEGHGLFEVGGAVPGSDLSSDRRRLRAQRRLCARASQGPDDMTEKRAFLNFVPCFGGGTIQQRRYINFHYSASRSRRFAPPMVPCASGNRFPRVARPSTVSAHGRCPRPPRLPPAVVG
jgi:hypothetical protein